MPHVGVVEVRLSAPSASGPSRCRGVTLAFSSLSAGEHVSTTFAAAHPKERPHSVRSNVVRPHEGTERRSPARLEVGVNPDDFPAPREGFVITQFLVVSDQDRSRDFYQTIFDGTVVLERDP